MGTTEAFFFPLLESYQCLRLAVSNAEGCRAKSLTSKILSFRIGKGSSQPRLCSCLCWELEVAQRHLPAQLALVFPQKHEQVLDFLMACAGVSFDLGVIMYHTNTSHPAPEGKVLSWMYRTKHRATGTTLESFLHCWVVRQNLGVSWQQASCAG